MNNATSLKRISIDNLRVGMYVHDVNCSWVDHPFLTSGFLVKTDKTINEIRALGVHELFIDTRKGRNFVSEEQPADKKNNGFDAEMEELALEIEAEPARAELAQEAERARKLKGEANRIVRDMLVDVRLGKQIQLEQVEPLVEKMVDSIFRNQDAMLPLLRLKEHDKYTFQHSVSVCALLVSFARGMGLERTTIKEIGIGGLLHDVGKAKVPDDILNKPAKLTEAEFGKMKSHVVQSIVILQNTTGISQIALDVAGQHHERFDGTGYPNKLKGEDISIFGRMGAIVDVYDAITSDRVYHKGMPPTAALSRILEWSAYHFDPELVHIFIKSIGIYPTGSLVRLESGRLGVVIEQHPEKLMKPKVKVIFHATHQRYLTPEVLDLSWTGCQDRIISHEAFPDWGIDSKRWIDNG